MEVAGGAVGVAVVGEHTAPVQAGEAEQPAAVRISKLAPTRSTEPQRRRSRCRRLALGEALDELEDLGDQLAR
jgi:hypothetical protein